MGTFPVASRCESSGMGSLFFRLTGKVTEMLTVGFVACWHIRQKTTLKRYRMSTKRKSQIPTDHPADRSDVLSVLENIRNMFTASRNSLNTFARDGMNFAIAMEAQMLAMKLGQMAERWRVHIPFKEACSVDFYSWAKEVESMSAYYLNFYTEADTEEFDDCCPDKHFLLDLYALLDEDLEGRKLSLVSDGRPYYMERVMTTFISRQEQMHRMLCEHWPDYLDRFSGLTAGRLVEVVRSAKEREVQQDEKWSDVDTDSFALLLDVMRAAGGGIRFVCHVALDLLAEQLHLLNERLCNNYSTDHFSRLVDRIFLEKEYEGRKVATNVRKEVGEWYNGIPEEEIAAGRDREMRNAYELMAEMKFGGKRFDAYVRKFEPDIEKKKSAIGKFLFNSRRSITRQDLKTFMEMYFSIVYHRKRQLEEEEAGLPPQPLANQENESPAGPEEKSLATDKMPSPSAPDITGYLSERLACDSAALQRFHRLLDCASRTSAERWTSRNAVTLLSASMKVGHGSI